MQPGRKRRINRWDRPPQPHDWRFYVGGVGKILIATGLLIFGFVAYQLWGTGIETARAQDQLEHEFEDLLDEFGGPDATAPVLDAEPENDPAVRPADDDVTDPSAETTPETDARTAVIPVAIDLSDQAVVQDPIPQPFRGDPLLRLEIPAIGRDDIVVPGVALNDLKDGPGHYPDTPLPGQLGNAAIAGHRTTYGAPFFDVDQLSAGDEIITTLLNGDRFVYEVTNVDVVSASDYWVVTTTDPNIAELTLTSCHPKYTARDRIVVRSVLNPAKSSNVGVPTFYSLDAEPADEPLPGDDPVLSAPAAENTDPAPAAVETGETVVTAPPAAAPEAPSGDESLESTATGEPSAGEGAVPEASGSAPPASAGPSEAPTPIDAFDEGWFDDAAAFPQIALWGLVLTLISVLAYQIAKRFRRVWVGVTVGILPFLVALYFFYQNVNRLLPAGI